MILKITLELTPEHNFRTTDGRSREELNPKELLLYATADCAGLTILSLLKEHIADVMSLEVTIEGSLSTPTVVAESRFTHFNIIYHAECKGLKEQMVISRAINLTHDKYCGLLQMMRQVAPVSHETAIVTTQELTS